MLLLKIENKDSKKLKPFLETTRVDQPESSAQSEQAEAGQQRKCVREN